MNRPIPEAYCDALDAPCATCGVQPGQYCLVDDDRHGPRVRRVPCVRRCPPGFALEQPPARPARSFCEPLHDPPNSEE